MVTSTCGHSGQGRARRAALPLLLGALLAAPAAHATSGLVVSSQDVATSGAADWEAFTIDADTYLAVANGFDGSTHEIDSKLYQWNGASFDEIDAIASLGAADWEAFRIDGAPYLALANEQSDASFNVDSALLLVPEPGTLLLVLAGCAGLAGRGRRRACGSRQRRPTPAS